MRSVKGSFTVEAAIIIPLFVVLLAMGMKLGMSIYKEIEEEQGIGCCENVWVVDDYYRYQILGEVADDK